MWDPPSSRQAAAIESLPAQGSSDILLAALLPGAQPHQSKASVATMGPYLASPLSLSWGVQVRLGFVPACSPLHPRRCKLTFRHHTTAFICHQEARARAPCMLSNLVTPLPPWPFPRHPSAHRPQPAPEPSMAGQTGADGTQYIPLHTLSQPSNFDKPYLPHALAICHETWPPHS